MCGVAGFVDIGSRRIDQEETLNRMVSLLAHRGPDDAGTWIDLELGIAFGHRRLAVIDLSPAGRQPMLSASGRYVIVYNGEIYNHREIRTELDEFDPGTKCAFRGHSDTETILAAIDRWGLVDAVKRMVGMFAFAVWDRNERILHLGRDRIGEKPLYYGWAGNSLLFASELKVFRAHPEWRGEINRNALALFLRHNYVPAPYSIFTGIHKLLAGTILSVPMHSFVRSCLPDPVPYWSVREIAEKGASAEFDSDEEGTASRLEDLLRAAIRQQMIADVPLGAFLSGGIDSSTVVALMQSLANRPVRTFTIGFHDSEYNEAVHARAVALHLGTDHTEMYLTSQDALDVIPKLPNLYDEPFSDSSQIPTYLLSKMTREHVTVSLSGDAGDELFGGYPRYALCRSVWRKIGWMPMFARRLLAKGVGAAGRGFLVRSLAPLVLRNALYGRNGDVIDKVVKMSEILSVHSMEDLYRGIVSHWKDPGAVVKGGYEDPTPLTDRSCWADLPDYARKMMFLDMVSYLPDDILVKVDRAAMGVSLETRIPFLDHRVVEFAWRLPLGMKIRDGEGKWILRQVLHQYVPKRLVERPKMGFGVPICDWLRGPLREWAESLLDEKRLTEEGFFHPSPIREKWSEHLAGTHRWHYYIWDVLMFQSWLEHNRSNRHGTNA